MVSGVFEPYYPGNYHRMVRMIRFTRVGRCTCRRVSVEQLIWIWNFDLKNCKTARLPIPNSFMVAFVVAVMTVNAVVVVVMVVFMIIFIEPGH